MGPVSAEIEIDVPREEAFEAIADLARRPAFTDDFLTGFRLTRIESSGVGAGARFRLGPRRRAIWMDTRIDELDPPHRVVEHGRGGRANRIPATTVWELLEGSGGLTRVRVSHWTEPANPVDRLLEALSGTARWQERRWREALRRLRDLLESDGPPPSRVAVAAGNRHETGIP
jgi:carbon monoxide dehydrogenase subunit G